MIKVSVRRNLLVVVVAVIVLTMASPAQRVTGMGIVSKFFWCSFCAVVRTIIVVSSLVLTCSSSSSRYFNPLFSSINTTRKGFFCNKNDRCEATTSSGDKARRTDDDCKDINKNLRKSGANKSGCKVDARGKRTAQQNKRGGNKSGNRENEDGPCLSNSNCE